MRSITLTLALCTLGTCLANCGGAGGSASSSGPIAALPLPSATASAIPGPGLSLAQGDDWNTFGHDQLRSGYDALPNNIAAESARGLRLAWSFQSSGGFWASPIVVNGIVYVADIKGLVSALNAATGSVIWQKHFNAEMQMTPAIYNGVLFIGTHESPAELYALDPATGNQLWQQPAGDFLRSEPVDVNGQLVIGNTYGDSTNCTADGLYEFNEQTGAPGPAWLVEGGAADGGGVWGPLTYTGSSIAFGTSNSCNDSEGTANAIVSTTPGLTQQWAVQTAPGYIDDDVASGVLDVNGIGYASGKNGTLYAVNLATGATQWSKPLGAPDQLGGFATPGYLNGTLFASRGYTTNPYYTGPESPGGMLYGLTTSGTVRWTIPTQRIMLGQVVGVNDVAFAELDNSINALSPSTGNILWSFQTNGDFEASPAVVPSGLFVADLSGQVYAFTLTAPGAPPKYASVHRSTPNAYVPRIPKHCEVVPAVLGQ